MTRIQVAGAQLSVRVEGPAEAPVLMILHGGLGDSSDLAPLAAELTGFRLVFLDSRGHGRSTGWARRIEPAGR